jgi:hypothetical protein
MLTGKFLIKPLVVVLTLYTFFSSFAVAAPMPANRAEAQKVSRHVDSNLQNQWVNCSSQGEMSQDNCMYGYTALTFDDAMKKEGYSYKDTLHQIAQSNSMTSYMDSGLKSMFSPMAALQTKQGTKFFVQHDLVYKKDVKALRGIFAENYPDAIKQKQGKHHSRRYENLSDSL